MNSFPVFVIKGFTICKMQVGWFIRPQNYISAFMKKKNFSFFLLFKKTNE